MKIIYILLISVLSKAKISSHMLNYSVGYAYPEFYYYTDVCILMLSESVVERGSNLCPPLFYF